MSRELNTHALVRAAHGSWCWRNTNTVKHQKQQELMKRRMRLVLLLLSRLAELNHLNQWERNQPFLALPAGTIHQTHRVLYEDVMMRCYMMMLYDVMMWCYVIMWCDILTDSSITAENIWWILKVYTGSGLFIYKQSISIQDIWSSFPQTLIICGQ